MKKHDVNSVVNGQTLLHVAARGTCTEILSKLINNYNLFRTKHFVQGTNFIEEETIYGETAMFLAVRDGPRNSVCAYIKNLQRMGANVATKDGRGNNLMHALTLAVHIMTKHSLQTWRMRLLVCQQM